MHSLQLLFEQYLFQYLLCSVKDVALGLLIDGNKNTQNLNKTTNNNNYMEGKNDDSMSVLGKTTLGKGW